VKGYRLKGGKEGKKRLLKLHGAWMGRYKVIG